MKVIILTSLLAFSPVVGDPAYSDAVPDTVTEMAKSLCKDWDGLKHVKMIKHSQDMIHYKVWCNKGPGSWISVIKM